MRQLKQVWSLLLLGCVCCGDPASAAISSEGDVARKDGGAAAPRERDSGPPKPSTPASTCGARYTTRACTCESLDGSQYCSSKGWTECECQKPEGGSVRGSTATPLQDGTSTPAGNLRSDIHFDWERTPFTEGSCEPGYYEGTFWGYFASSVTVVGAPIPVFALGTPEHPGLAFTLTKKPGGGEELVIENGIMDGVADGVFPFKGTLTGSLNCDTLEFDAILDGYYSLGVDGVGMFKFKGPLLGGYDKSTRSIIDATWNVKEYPDPIADHIGGGGEWEAKWLRP
jgi:hypothetical protein